MLATTLALAAVLGSFQAQASPFSQSGDSPALTKRGFKPCRDYEVGLGKSQLCGIGGGEYQATCGGVFNTIFTSDCENKMSMGNEEWWCNGGYTHGWDVSECAGSDPKVLTNGNGQRFGDCYRPGDGNCVRTFGGFGTNYDYVHWCCQEL